MGDDVRKALRDGAGEVVKILAVLVAFFAGVGVVVAGMAGVWMISAVGVRACVLVHERLQQWSW